MPDTDLEATISSVCDDIVDYLMANREMAPGEFFGSFWSEKGYHGPLLDYHAGGSHHHRGAGSAALGLWLVGSERGDEDMLRAAEWAFDWLAARQHERGGYTEIQNNEVPADWERTGLTELSTIATGFVVHGLGWALLHGLPPKKLYLDCLKRAAHWQLSIEWPAGSGVFPHHERSPYNTLNANLHAAETLGVAFAALRQCYDLPVNIFLQGAKRAVKRTLASQWDNGCMPYRDPGKVTINYTSLVLWCLMNVREALPAPYLSDPADQAVVQQAIQQACEFLRNCVAEDGALRWEEYETSTAKYNMWTYLITANVLMRAGGEANRDIARKVLQHAFTKRTESGLLPMRDRGKDITECVFMQADMLLFLLPLRTAEAAGKEV